MGEPSALSCLGILSRFSLGVASWRRRWFLLKIKWVLIGTSIINRGLGKFIDWEPATKTVD